MSDMLYPPYSIETMVANLSHRISHHCSFQGIQEITPIVILKGSFIFAADLIRALEHRKVTVGNIEFMQVTHYRDNEKLFEPEILSAKIDTALLEDRHVLVMDDILDTGRTLTAVVEFLRTHHCCSTIMTTVLMSRRIPMVEGVECFIGETNIGEGWVYGYGMDDHDQHRGSAGVRIIRED